MRTALLRASRIFKSKWGRTWVLFGLLNEGIYLALIIKLLIDPGLKTGIGICVFLVAALFCYYMSTKNVLAAIRD
jgi:hypothetical protein